ncbi:MAG: type II secretion system protein [Candidatus Levybacteria bacterium]|nr:type II secretion system protein [Candidatus Levybacteria bacterium]
MGDKQRERAHTLVELLVAMGIIASAGGIVLSIFFLALRGSTKTDTLTVVRQNGNNAISQIAHLIRNARRFDGVSNDGVNFQNNCVQQQANPTPTPVPYQYVRITSNDPGQSTFICNYNPSPDPITIASASSPVPSPAVTPPPALLLDTDVVSLDSCYFTCYQETTAQNPVIGIHFLLSARTESGFVERSASIPFDTSILLRNKD